MKNLFYFLGLLLMFSCQDTEKIESIESQQEQILTSLEDLKDKYQISADPCDRCYAQAYGVCKNIGNDQVYQQCMNDPNKHLAYGECKANCERVVKALQTKGN